MRFSLNKDTFHVKLKLFTHVDMLSKYLGKPPHPQSITQLHYNIATLS